MKQQHRHGRGHHHTAGDAQGHPRARHHHHHRGHRGHHGHHGRRGHAATGEGFEPVHPSLIRAIENLKLAMRLRLQRGGIDLATAQRIAAQLDEAAQAIERS